MPDYKLIIENGTQATSSIKSEPSNILATAPKQKVNVSGFANNFQQNLLSSQIITPLNSATGGLASPVYQVGRGLIGGSSALASAGLANLAMVGVIFALSTLQKRVEKMENKAEEMNNKDNVLIRAGSKSTDSATFYKGGLFGVKSTNRSN